MRKPNIVFIGAFCALISIINADSSETTNGEPPAVVEKPIQKLYVLQPGEKEYLSPNLIGVQNIAITNIPETMNFINIIDAYREVVDGVRYEIILNAVNTTDNNTEIVCRVVVLEKPWLTTLWGDKLRLLQESNCTSEKLPDLARDRKSLQEKYETNAIFTGSRNELTNDEMSNLESQIIGSSSKNPQLVRQRPVYPPPTPTTESVISQTVATQEVKTEVVLSEASSGNAKDSVVSSSDSEATTTEQIPELSNNEQKWLDDFLSIGAYNFETSLEKQKANRALNQAQANSQESDKEKTSTATPLVGGTGQLSEEDLKIEIENLSKSLTKLASGDSPPPLNLDKCHSGSRQIVAGTLVKLDCDMIDDQTGIKDRCLMSIWSRPWLKEDGYEVTFECRDSPKSVHRHSRSIGDEFQRRTRNVLGGPSELSDEDLRVEEENLSQSIKKLASGDSPTTLTLDKCHSGSRQVVAGSSVKLDCDMVDSKTGKKDRCTVSIWSRSWLKEDGYEVTFECKDRPKSVHRHSRSVGEETQSEGFVVGGLSQISDKELKEEEENLSKSLTKLASGDSPPSLTLHKCHSGSKQVVAGSLVKLDCDMVDSKTGKKDRCMVSIWSQPWLAEDGYEVTFECKDRPKSVHRHSRSVDAVRKTRDVMPGAPSQIDDEELKKEEENLSKSLTKLASGDSPPSLTVHKCHSGSKIVVAGSLVKLDCDMVDSKTGKKDRCMVSIWSQPWLPEDGYEVTFECKDRPKSVHRHSRSVDSGFQRKTSEVSFGAPSQINDEALKEEEENLSQSIAKLASGDSPTSLTLEKCHSGSRQVVAGSLVKLDCDMVDSKTGKKDRCKVSIWSRSWLKEDGYEVTFECKDRPKSVHRHSRSVDAKRFKRSEKNLINKGGVTPLTDFELNEQEGRISQSLAKIASGDGPSYSISRSFNGTKQTVAGSLVKIYAELVDGNTGGKENCTVSLWSRPWIPIDGYEVTFECKNKQKAIHRHSRSVETIEKKNKFKKSHDSLDKAEHLFQKFQTKFNKKYHNSMERQMRLRIFKHNLKLIYDLNKNEMGSAKYGITEFADMTTTEYRERTGLLSREEGNSVRSPAIIPDVKLPKEFDWREKGAISKVKNQGNCGSCWAFSVTGNIEGLHAVKTGKLEEYSEQELLDCDTVDSACNGGLPDNAYEAIEKIGGLELESEYPYQAKKGQCHFNNTLSRVKLSGAVDLPKNETQMAQWLIANGPISIGINANAMQFYRGGVSHPWKMLCSKKSLDHGVLIVGYGVSEYPKFKKILPYWIVKNSWGPKWGEQGYYRVYRGDNTCGVSEMPTSAVLA